uniref:Uncharacterized protein n=1 Tax=Tanacetum cinerariifolium TaxID=118510 RepID=A0A699TZ05_TANCI|nr:hypothetical protein [Tanacetum cinerariifolium]
MIDSLDKSNETIAKYLQEYQEFASELPLEKKIELISDLVKYQEHYTKVHKFQSQQRRPMTKKQKREYYMAVIKSNLGWRFKDFKETERLKRRGLNLEKEQVKKQKSSEEAPEIETTTKEFTEEKIKEMMQLVPVELEGSFRRSDELLADHKIGWQLCLLSILCRSPKTTR